MPTDTTAHDLAEYLRGEADWMDERAAVLEKSAGYLPDRPAASAEVRAHLRAEAARFRARALLVRMEAAKATE